MRPTPGRRPHLAGDRGDVKRRGVSEPCGTAVAARQPPVHHVLPSTGTNRSTRAATNARSCRRRVLPLNHKPFEFTAVSAHLQGQHLPDERQKRRRVFLRLRPQVLTPPSASNACRIISFRASVALFFEPGLRPPWPFWNVVALLTALGQSPSLWAQRCRSAGKGQGAGPDRFPLERPPGASWRPSWACWRQG